MVFWFELPSVPPTTYIKPSEAAAAVYPRAPPKAVVVLHVPIVPLGLIGAYLTAEE